MYKNIVGCTPEKSKDTNIVNLTRIETPLGTMIACASQKGICMLEFSDSKKLETELGQITKAFKSTIIQVHNPLFDRLEEQLAKYFKGELKVFDIPLDPVGTDFQKSVWDVLLQIPYGVTTSYANEAEMLRNPKAVRAVANANGVNKISIIIPCHRIIGSDGSLTGYGGGLWRKKRLLDLEKLHKDDFLIGSIE